MSPCGTGNTLRRDVESACLGPPLPGGCRIPTRDSGRSIGACVSDLPAVQIAADGGIRCEVVGAVDRVRVNLGSKLDHDFVHGYTVTAL